MRVVLMILVLMAKSKNSGASAVEYALLAGLLALAIVASLQLVESEISSTFNELADELQ